ncbi:hypothetical protein DFH09DRAFT_1319654 [Mycena vulgaris]|nr:hypothetical protein DFH09DRAFT_1319654 [Mycena vulgaris]
MCPPFPRKALLSRNARSWVSEECSDALSALLLLVFVLAYPRSPLSASPPPKREDQHEESAQSASSPASSLLRASVRPPFSPRRNRKRRAEDGPTSVPRSLRVLAPRSARTCRPAKRDALITPPPSLQRPGPCAFHPRNTPSPTPSAYFHAACAPSRPARLKRKARRNIPPCMDIGTPRTDAPSSPP